MDKLTKLSDAIRLGATFRPQCFGTFFTLDSSLDNPQIVKTCALGAAAEAIGIELREPGVVVIGPLSKRFGVPDSVLLDIAAKNDKCNWSRERIADWLAELGI